MLAGSLPELLQPQPLPMPGLEPLQCRLGVGPELGIAAILFGLLGLSLLGRTPVRAGQFQQLPCRRSHLGHDQVDALGRL